MTSNKVNLDLKVQKLETDINLQTPRIENLTKKISLSKKLIIGLSIWIIIIMFIVGVLLTHIFFLIDKQNEKLQNSLTSISTPSTSIPTLSTSISTPSTSISTPSTSISTPSTSISTPSTSIPTPSTSISTPSTSISTPISNNLEQIINNFQTQITLQTRITTLQTQITTLQDLQTQINNFQTQITILQNRINSSIIPPGSIVAFPSNIIPSGWLDCNGSLVSRTIYSQLFSVIGVTFNIGDGITNFGLPNLNGRVIVGSGIGELLSMRNIGDMFGTENHTLSIAEMPTHQHGTSWGETPSVSTGKYGSNGCCSLGSRGNDYDNSEFLSEPKGLNFPHNNLQPSLVLKYIIKY